MTITEENIATVRTCLLTLTGLSCLLYAIMALISNRPDPFWWFIPGALGVFAGLGTTLVFMLATPKVRRMASDEMYIQITHRAQRNAYWMTLAMFPIFAIGVFIFGLEWNTVFAAMGTLTGAVYLLRLTHLEWRAR
jgi:hypothetical protein